MKNKLKNYILSLLILVALVLLKITAIINISWLLITLPVTLPLAAIVIGVILVKLGILKIEQLEKMQDTLEKKVESLEKNME